MQRPDWYLDELAHAGPEHLDPDYVATYDRKAGTDPGEDVAALRALGLGDESVLVDFGAGTGTFALAAAPYCRRVVAVDVSPAMLDILRAETARRGLSNAEVAHAGFLSYEHQGQPTDFVYSRNALHHLPDFWKGLALARVAAMHQHSPEWLMEHDSPSRGWRRSFALAASSSCATSSTPSRRPRRVL